MGTVRKPRSLVMGLAAVPYRTARYETQGFGLVLSSGTNTSSEYDNKKFGGREREQCLDSLSKKFLNGEEGDLWL